MWYKYFIGTSGKMFRTSRKFLRMPAHFFEQDIQAKLKDKRKLSAYLDSLVHRHLEVKKIQLNYIFCNDEYLLQINKEYLSHNTLTDIITFDMSETENDLTGEIYVSAERVVENAAKFGTDYNNELHRVIFHGALHLCGFKDKKPEEEKEMRRQEDICLKEYL
jgi:probable rRNA maturation factor